MDTTLRKDKIGQFIDGLGWDINPEVIKNQLTYSISLETELSENEEITLGQSKVGGRPDLPKNVDWFHTQEGVAMGFVAQFNFADLKQFDAEQVLPQKGILYFFLYEDFDEFETTNHDRYKVFFTENTDQLERKDYPETLDFMARFMPCRVFFRSDFTLPTYPSYKMAEVKMSESDMEKLSETDLKICEFTGRKIACEDWILGAPRILREDVYEAWAKKAGKKPQDFRLLLQISFLDSNSVWYMHGGDAGIAYWGITEEDLKNKDFEKSVLVRQLP